MDDRQNYNGIPDLTPERICKALQNAIDKVDGESTIPQKRSRKKPGDALRRALATSLNEFPPVLIDHGLRLTAFDPSTPIEEVMRDSQTMAKLVLALREAQNVVDSISSCQPCKGYIIIRQAKRAAAATQAQALDDTEGGKEEHRYEDFHPFRPQQFADSPETILQFDSFNKTVDEFFSSIESQKLESRLTEKEENAKRKLDMARLDHEKRLGGLQQVQEVNVRKAQAIEANLQKVQEAMAAVNNLIFQGMDWAEIARLIEMEQERKNVVAEMIKLPLKLYENTATLLLAEATYDDLDDYDGDETGSDVSDVEVDETSLSKRTDLAKPADKRLAVDIG